MPEGRRIKKRWGALFTCLTIRVIQIKVDFKLDTDNFILSFTNFINIKGKPRHIELKKIDLGLIARKFTKSGN